MKLSSILTSKTVRFLFGTFQSGSAYIPHVNKLMHERFGFLGLPKSLEEMDGNKGIKFMHGNFNGITIDLLEVFNDGLVVHTKTNTNQADRFIDGLIDTVKKELNFVPQEIPHRSRMYISELEVSLDKDIAGAFKNFSKVAELITASISELADETPSMQGTGLVFNYDVTKSPHIKPVRFTLERRAESAFDTNLYFSSAPLPTDAHLSVLQEIERAL
jgi:hypothetical protein